jgi:3-phenylpropionate/cinnamic acid dioxygenase small subunit
MTTQVTGVHAEVWDFLVNESAALDEHRHGDWLGLLTDDFVYEIPVPRSREDLTQSPYDMTTFLAHESKSFLQMRFTRLSSDHDWSEHPPAFFRHFISNFRVVEELDGESWTVATNVRVVRARLPEPTTMSTAARRDIIVATPDGLRLRHRVVFLDTALPTDGQLGVIY